MRAGVVAHNSPNALAISRRAHLKNHVHAMSTPPIPLGMARKSYPKFFLFFMQKGQWSVDTTARSLLRNPLHSFLDGVHGETQRCGTNVGGTLKPGLSGVPLG